MPYNIQIYSFTTIGGLKNCSPVSFEGHLVGLDPVVPVQIHPAISNLRIACKPFYAINDSEFANELTRVTRNFYTPRDKIATLASPIQTQF